MATCYLPSWVHLSFTLDGAVFLDVKRDKYVGLDARNTQLLRELAQGQELTNDDARKLSRELYAQGLLADGGPNAHPLAPAEVEVPSVLIPEAPLDARARITPSRLLVFVRACIAVSFLLRFGSLEAALSRLKRLKRAAGQKQPADTERAQVLMHVFSNLRPFFYVAEDHCLLNSLILTEFLVRQGVDATCVLGVRTLPFSAHCWVQTCGFLAFEEGHESVRTFVPIHAV